MRAESRNRRWHRWAGPSTGLLHPSPQAAGLNLPGALLPSPTCSAAGSTSSQSRWDSRLQSPQDFALPSDVFRLSPRDTGAHQRKLSGFLISPHLLFYTKETGEASPSSAPWRRGARRGRGCPQPLSPSCRHPLLSGSSLPRYFFNKQKVLCTMLCDHVGKLW